MTDTNRTQISGPVDDSLRDRIATALGGELHVNLLGNGYDVDDLLALADAVINTLGLRQEWGALAHDGSGTLHDTREEVKPWPGETIKTRYITEWANDNE